jgi:hypothetical protein
MLTVFCLFVTEYKYIKSLYQLTKIILNQGFANTKLNASCSGLVVEEVLERWRLLGKGSSGSGDPVGDNGGEARGQNTSSVSSVVGNCSAIELIELEG